MWLWETRHAASWAAPQAASLAPSAPRTPPPTWLLLSASLCLCFSLGAPCLQGWHRGAGEGLPGHPQGPQQVVLQVHAHASQPFLQLCKAGGNWVWGWWLHQQPWAGGQGLPVPYPGASSSCPCGGAAASAQTPGLGRSWARSDMPRGQTDRGTQEGDSGRARAPRASCRTALVLVPTGW